MTIRTNVTAIAACIIAGAAHAQDWKILKPSNTGIPGEEARFNLFAPDGKLWVAARWPFWREGGIGIYDFATDTWETWANWETPIPSEFVNDIEFVADGSVWIATSAGLVHKDDDAWTVYTRSNSPLRHNVIQGIDLDADGHVWINNTGVQQSNHAIFEFDGVNWTSYDTGVEMPWDETWDSLSSVMVASDGHVFVANEVLNGIAQFDGTSWVLHDGPTRFRRLREDHDGNLWMSAGIGGGNSFYKFDRTNNAFETFSPARVGMTSTTPTAITIAPSGDIYLANWFGQAVRSSNAGDSWESFTDQGIRITSLAFAGNGDVWVTTPGATRHLDSNGMWLEAFNSYNTGIPDYFIDNFYRDRSGDMWIATGEAGASRYDYQRWTNWGMHNAGQNPWPFLAEQAHGFYEDDDGRLWIGSNGVGAWNGNDFQIWDWRNSNLGVEIFQAIGVDPNGRMWIGGDFSGLYGQSGNNWQQRSLGGSLAHGDIRAIESDSQGNMWVASEASLHRFDGTTWTDWDWTEYDILFDQRGIVSMTVGPDDTIWLGMGDGLINFDGQTFTLYDTANSPLPGKTVSGIVFRDDGLMALSAHTFQPQTPFPHGLCVIAGDINDDTAWTIYTFQNSPMPHYQLGDVEFDADGRLWLSTISEGAATVLIPPLTCPADLDADGDADADDFFMYLDLFAAGDPAADLDNDGDTDADDFFAYLDLFATGC